MRKIYALGVALIPYLVIRFFLFLRIDNYIATWEIISSANIVISRIYSFKQLLLGSLHPFYRVCLKLILMGVDNSLVFAPLFNFTLSILLAVVFYFYVYDYFGKSNAFFSLMIFSFMPVISLQAVISTENVLMHLLLFLSFYCFRKYLDSRDKKQLLLFILFLNLGHLTRFESWMLLPFFIFAFIAAVKDTNLRIAGSVGMAIIPIASFLYKTPLADIKEQSLTAAYDIKVITESGFFVATGIKGFFTWFIIMMQTGGSFWLVCALSGVLLALLKRKERLYSFSALLFLGVLSIKSAKGDLVPHPRYITTVMLMLIPYFYYFIENVMDFVSLKKKRKVVFWIFGLSVAFNMLFLNIDVYGQRLFSLKEVIIHSSEYLEKDDTVFMEAKDIIPKNSTVFVDMDYYGKDYDDIIAYGVDTSCKVFHFEDRSFMADTAYADMMRKDIKRRILTNKPIYLVLSKGGAFEFLFGKDVVWIQSADNMFEYKDWRILHLE